MSGMCRRCRYDVALPTSDADLCRHCEDLVARLAYEQQIADQQAQHDAAVAAQDEAAA